LAFGKEKGTVLNETLCFLTSSALADILALRNRQLIADKNH